MENFEILDFCYFMINDFIYLDYNVIMLMYLCVIDVVFEVCVYYGNLFLIYGVGCKSCVLIECFCEELVFLLEVDVVNVIFISGGIELNNLVIKCLVVIGVVDYIVILVLEYEFVCECVEV